MIDENRTVEYISNFTLIILATTLDSLLFLEAIMSVIIPRM